MVIPLKNHHGKVNGMADSVVSILPGRMKRRALTTLAMMTLAAAVSSSLKSKRWWNFPSDTQVFSRPLVSRYHSRLQTLFTLYYTLFCPICIIVHDCVSSPPPLPPSPHVESYCMAPLEQGRRWWPEQWPMKQAPSSSSSMVTVEDANLVSLME